MLWYASYIHPFASTCAYWILLPCLESIFTYSTYKLNTPFNEALRTISGCMKPTRVSFLPFLAGIESLENRCHYACKKLLLRANNQDHPLHQMMYCSHKITTSLSTSTEKPRPNNFCSRPLSSWRSNWVYPIVVERALWLQTSTQAMGPAQQTTQPIWTICLWHASLGPF